MAAAGGVAELVPPFNPTHTLSFLIHGSFSADLALTPLPDNIEIVTFTRRGNILQYEDARMLMFLLSYNWDFHRTDISEIDENSYALTLPGGVRCSDIRVRVHRRSIPNFPLEFEPPGGIFFNILGLYQTVGASISRSGVIPIETTNFLAPMTEALKGTLPNPLNFNVSNLITFLSHNIPPPNRLRLYLLCCASYNPSNPLAKCGAGLNMEEEVSESHSLYNLLKSYEPAPAPVAEEEEGGEGMPGGIMNLEKPSGGKRKVKRKNTRNKRKGRKGAGKRRTRRN